MSLHKYTHRDLASIKLHFTSIHHILPQNASNMLWWIILIITQICTSNFSVIFNGILAVAPCSKMGCCNIYANINVFLSVTSWTHKSAFIKFVRMLCCAHNYWTSFSQHRNHIVPRYSNLNFFSPTYLIVSVRYRRGLTNRATLCGRILLEKLNGHSASQELPAFYGIWRSNSRFSKDENTIFFFKVNV